MSYIFKYSKRYRCKAKSHQKLDSRVKRNGSTRSVEECIPNEDVGNEKGRHDRSEASERSFPTKTLGTRKYFSEKL